MVQPIKIRFFAILFTFGLTAGAVMVGQSEPLGATADQFFGLTNLYSFHLNIASEEWAKMETYDRPATSTPSVIK